MFLLLCFLISLQIGEPGGRCSSNTVAIKDNEGWLKNLNLNQIHKPGRE